MMAAMEPPPGKSASGALPTSLRAMVQASDRFLFRSCEPDTVVLFRILFGIVLVIYTIFWIWDAPKWFYESGVLGASTAIELGGFSRASLFFHFEPTPAAVQCCLAAMLLQALLLTCGVYSRFQAFGILVWLTTFQNLNPLILDGADNILRWFALFAMLMPLDAYWSPIRHRRSVEEWRAAAWALRLVQLQMVVIYLSTVWCKLQGETWRDGSALFYVIQSSDYMQSRALLEWLVQFPIGIRLATWGTLVVETLIPIGVWVRPLRKWALLLGLAFHLGIEWSMHLFLFQWVMLLGLLSFVRAEEWLPSRRRRSATDADDSVHGDAEGAFNQGR